MSTTFRQLYDETAKLLPQDHSFSLDVEVWCHRHHRTEPGITLEFRFYDADGPEPHHINAASAEALLAAIRTRYLPPDVQAGMEAVDAEALPAATQQPA